MAASPSYGERPPLQGAFRRSFTTPTRQLSFHEKAGLEKADAGAEILYSHSSVRIISFSPPKESIKSTSKAEIPADTDYPVDTVETLPWRSRTETLAASGVMVLEKVRGSTNFLKCQSVTHAILRNSQCWCVDGQSKFVLRVRKFQYYRIELPSTTEEDKAKVEELKKVFPTLLKYERTPCPFIRAFTVDLPDDAITPRRKGQWKRRDSSQPNTPDTETPPLRRTGQTRSWSLRSPPTSYPKHGPASSLENFENDRGRTASPSSILRRASLFENRRNDSPASSILSDEGTDSEHQPSEHESELGDTPDRSETDSPKIQPEAGNTGSALTSLHNPKRPLRDVSNQSDTQEQSDMASVTSGKPEAFGDAKADDLLSQSSSLPEVKQDTEGPSVAELITTTNPSELPEDQEAMTEVSIVDTKVSSRQGRTEFVNFGSSENEVPAIASTSIEALPGTRPIPTTLSAKLQTTNDFDMSTESAAEKSIAAIEVLEGNAMTSIPETDDNNTDHPTASESEPEPSMSPVLNLNALGQSVSHKSFMSGQESEDEHPDYSNRTSQISSIASQLVEELSGHVSEEVQIDTGDESQSTDDDSRSAEVNSLFEFNDRIPRQSLTTRQLDGHNDGGHDHDENDDEDDNRSTTSSIDSFHTLASPLANPSAGNLYEISHLLDHGVEEPESPTFARHRRDISELTVTASSIPDRIPPARDIFLQQDVDQSQTPGSIQPMVSSSSGPESTTPLPSITDQEGLRQRHKKQRSFSPLPPASTIFTGNQIRHGTGSGHMTKVILQKIIVKPLEVAIMVVHILTRIAGGATVNDLLSGELFKRPEHTRSLSGLADQRHQSKGASDTEDDYGVPIRGRQRSDGRSEARTANNETFASAADVD